MKGLQFGEGLVRFIFVCHMVLRDVLKCSDYSLAVEISLVALVVSVSLLGAATIYDLH